jgi:hypothetical protein
MLKNTLFGGVSYDICQFEWGTVPGQRPGSGSRDCEGSNKHNFLNTWPNGASEVLIGIYVKHT